MSSTLSLSGAAGLTRAIVLTAALVAFSLSASGQVGANVGGQVADSSGAAIPGATVVLKNKNTGVSQLQKAGTEGNYRAVNLTPANYEITAEAPGFGVTRKVVTLPVGSDVIVDLVLGIAGVTANVTVESGSSVLIEVAKSQPSSVINQQKLSELPVLDRNFLVIAQTMPGAAPVVNLNVTATRFAVTKFGGVADQASGYTTIIDGAPLDDSVWGVPVINMSQDAIQEFKVYRNQFDAQYGHALNAVVNVVTQSGGDKFHGTGYYFGRDAALNARNTLAIVPPPYDLTRAGGTIGGPLWKNTHFFGGMEYLKIATAAIIALPASNPFAGTQNGNYAYTKTEKMVDLKIDHRFSDTNNFYGRYAWDSQVSPTGGPANAQATAIDRSPAHSLVLEDNWIISPTAVNTVRYYFLHHNLNTLPANYDVGVTRPDYSFGQNTVDPQYFPRTNHTISDTIFLNRAKHDIKVGFDVTKAYNSYNAHFYEHGLFTFTTDAAFNINIPSTWPQSFVMQTAGNFHHREMDYSGFVQDDWRVLPNLRLNIGLRYDFNSNLRENHFYDSLLQNPLFTGINNFISPNRGTSWDGLQPRLGIAWDVTGHGKIVIRAGFGRYITRMRSYWDEASQNQTFGAAVRITDPNVLKNYPDITAVLGGQSLSSYVSNGGSRSVVLNPDNFRLPYSFNTTVGVGWKINPTSALNVDYVHTHSLQEVGETDKNLPATGAISATNPRPIARFTQVTEIVNNGSSWYDALEIGYNTRIKGFDSMQVSYTYSKSMINGVTWYSQFSGTDRTPNNYGYNPTDTPHNLSIAFTSKMLPGRIRLSGVFRGVSGGPLPVSAGFDLDGDGNITNDRPRGLPQTVGRGDVAGQLALINAFRASPCSYIYYTGVTCTAKPLGPVTAEMLKPQPTVSVDGRVTKEIRFGEKWRTELFFEGYNISNHVTKYGGSTTLTSASYLIHTSALPARQLQWGARVSF